MEKLLAAYQSMESVNDIYDSLRSMEVEIINKRHSDLTKVENCFKMIHKILDTKESEMISSINLYYDALSLKSQTSATQIEHTCTELMEHIENMQNHLNGRNTINKGLNTVSMEIDDHIAQITQIKTTLDQSTINDYNLPFDDIFHELKDLCHDYCISQHFQSPRFDIGSPEDCLSLIACDVSLSDHEPEDRYIDVDVDEVKVDSIEHRTESISELETCGNNGNHVKYIEIEDGNGSPLTSHDTEISNLILMNIKEQNNETRKMSVSSMDSLRPRLSFSLETSDINQFAKAY